VVARRLAYDERMTRAILVTNDDGIESPGLWTLARAVAPVGDRVYVVAPSVNQSAVGAGFSLRRELRWERLADPPVPGVEAWHLDGTPADCVMVGLDKIIEGPVDMVVSGVNFGGNVGQDILASGTVGGALHGHLRGKVAVAFSQVIGDGVSGHQDIDWSVAERVAGMIARAEVEGLLPEDLFLNVNVPRIAYEQIAGMLVTRMGRTGSVRLRELTGDSGVLQREVDINISPETPPGTDIWALAHNYVSVSPLQSNLTDHRLIDVLAQSLFAAFHS
jgi:5'-nucleotidase